MSKRRENQFREALDAELAKEQERRPIVTAHVRSGVS
jgi:hypothetical protein